MVVALVIGSIYGYFVHRNNIFPYKDLKKAYMTRFYKNRMDWSIGIYKGSSPFNLEGISENPVISAHDVSDVYAAFVADPFILKKSEEFFMFFEVLNMETYTGDIGYATSVDGEKWEYKKIILDEPFHLSYPCVFEWQGNYYMIPESGEDLSVRLYKALSFPDEWKYVGNLLTGYPFSDPTIFFHDNRWWMFTSNTGADVLNLFSSDSLATGWSSHPMNPLIENNKSISRPAGRIIEYDGKLYRLAQDNYEIQVYAFEITELTQNTYLENKDSIHTLVQKTGKGWNAAGMHQVDLYKLNGMWYAVVDGVSRRK